MKKPEVHLKHLHSLPESYINILSIIKYIHTSLSADIQLLCTLLCLLLATSCPLNNAHVQLSPKIEHGSHSVAKIERSRHSVQREAAATHPMRKRNVLFENYCMQTCSTRTPE